VRPANQLTITGVAAIKIRRPWSKACYMFRLVLSVDTKGLSLLRLNFCFSQTAEMETMPVITTKKKRKQETYYDKSP